MFKKQLSTILSAAILVFSAVSCDKLEEVFPEKSAEGSTTTYMIKKGRHSSTSKVTAMEASQMVFTATFDSSAIYKTTNTSNQADINKLYGISDCGTHHHQNSARFGWRWYNNQLEILAYSYENGERNFKFITSVALNKEYTYTLETTADAYVFKLDGKTVSTERSCEGAASGYKLFPYFGGNEKAPHDIKVLIRDFPPKN